MTSSRVSLTALALSCVLLSTAHGVLPKGKTVAPPPPKPVAELEGWIHLCSLRPTTELQAALLARDVDAGLAPWHAGKIELGYGPLLLDQRSLLITKMPVIDGKPLDQPALLEHVRKNLNSLLMPAVTLFTPITDADKTAWDSASPLGAVLALSADALGGKTALVVSDVSANRFAFTGLHAGQQSYAKPVFAWQRSFSVQDAVPFEGCIFTIRAVARAEAENLTAEQSQTAVGAPVWNALLNNVAEFVQKNGGTVETTLLPNVTTTASWDGVESQFHQPKNVWLDLDGNWQSTDPGRRFRVEVKGWTGKCDFIERNARGEELRMTLPLRIEREDGKPGLKFVIERPNDAKEVLDYYSFADPVRSEILAKNPLPSTLVLTRIGKKLSGDWRGMSIAKDASGKHLREFKQPGEIKAKAYPFTNASASAEVPPTVRKAEVVK